MFRLVLVGFRVLFQTVYFFFKKIGLHKKQPFFVPETKHFCTSIYESFNFICEQLNLLFWLFFLVRNTLVLWEVLIIHWFNDSRVPKVDNYATNMTRPLWTWNWWRTTKPQLITRIIPWLVKLTGWWWQGWCWMWQSKSLLIRWYRVWDSLWRAATVQFSDFPR